MQLDLDAVERLQRVGERVRVVGERTGVDDDRGAPATGRVDRVDELAFVVRLQVLERVTGRLGDRARVADHVVERVGPVDRGLALAEQVQVRSGEQQDRGHGVGLPRRAHADGPERRFERGRGRVVDRRELAGGVGQHEREPAVRLLVAAHERQQLVDRRGVGRYRHGEPETADQVEVGGRAAPG